MKEKRIDKIVMELYIAHNNTKARVIKIIITHTGLDNEK